LEPATHPRSLKYESVNSVDGKMVLFSEI
jgi:hypothetical protein